MTIEFTIEAEAHCIHMGVSVVSEELEKSEETSDNQQITKNPKQTSVMPKRQQGPTQWRNENY